MAVVKERVQVKNITEFLKYPAVAALRQLAIQPFDLTKEGHLTPERLDHFVAQSCGYTMLYGTERVTDEVMQALTRLASEAHAVDKMKRMQAGEMLNYIEGFP